LEEVQNEIPSHNSIETWRGRNAEGFAIVNVYPPEGAPEHLKDSFKRMFTDARHGRPCKRTNGTEFKVDWDAGYTSEVWSNFRQCMDEQGWPGVICIICKKILEHPRKEGTSSMKKHIQVKTCQKAAKVIVKRENKSTPCEVSETQDIGSLLARQGVVGQGVCTLNISNIRYIHG
jgi:hypothetical protein